VEDPEGKWEGRPTSSRRQKRTKYRRAMAEVSREGRSKWH